MTGRCRSPTIACHEHLLGSGLAPPGRHPAGRAARPRLGPGVFLLLVLLIAAAAYGATRIGRGRRQRKVADSAWRPGPQAPSPTGSGAPAGEGAAASSADRAGIPAPAGRAPPAPRSRARQRRPPAARDCTAGLPGGPAGGWAVETHGLTKRFGPNAAVDHVELLVPRGSAFGYLGPNGAGKTTLIRTLLGLTRADAGTMSLLGIRVPAERSRALARVGAIVDEPRFHHHLTGRENLRLLGAARGGDRQTDPGSLARVGLGERADDKVASYSMGMRQRLGVAACLLGDPDLLILDEPMNGLDPAGMHQMRAMIRSLVGEGRTVMLSSHLLDEVERTCDAVAIVDRGRVIRQGPIDELSAPRAPAPCGGLLRPRRGGPSPRAVRDRGGRCPRRAGADRDPAVRHLARDGGGGQAPACRGRHLRVRPPGGSRHPGGLVLVRDQPPGREP